MTLYARFKRPAMPAPIFTISEIDTILSEDDWVTERNSKDIEKCLKQWSRLHCNLIVQDGLLLETLDECLRWKSIPSRPAQAT